LVWNPVDPRSPEGPQIAALWGDPAKGAFGALLRVPAGFESPTHTHSMDERVVQLQGRSVHWARGDSRQTAPVMEPGDYLMIPAGVAHGSATPDDQNSLEFITMDGVFDFSFVDPIEEESWTS
ncbi:MAG TPA: cupin domain-containing protein, partial [Acidimicrobiia bacterium]|nr:cupin domain-containing protein [Acidimicrobiia bacterium]